MLCNNSSITAGFLHGQPTEGAILIVAQKMGMRDLRNEYVRVEPFEIPFSHEQKWMAVRCKALTGSNASQDTAMYHIKGAPEKILQMCVRYRGSNGFSLMNQKDLEFFVGEAKRLATGNGDGIRLLALAKGVRMDDLIFMGFVGIHDPPRKGVLEAIGLLQASGVQVKMVTGDAQETAKAICKFGIFVRWFLS